MGLSGWLGPVDDKAVSKELAGLDEKYRRNLRQLVAGEDNFFGTFS